MIRGRKGEYISIFQEMMKQGFVRARVDGEIMEVDGELKLEKNIKHTIEAVIDRIKIKEGIQSRLSDSIELALKLGDGLVIILSDDGEKLFSQNHSCKECGFSFAEIEPRTFSFNSPYGACPTCNGLGLVREVKADEDLSIAQGCYPKLRNSSFYTTILLGFCKTNNIPTNIPFKDLNSKHRELLLLGSSKPFSVKYNGMWGSSNVHEFQDGLAEVGS